MCDAMDEGVREQAKRYLEQQYALYGAPVLLERRNQRAQPAPTPRSDAPAASAFDALLSHVDEPWVNATSLESLRQMICECQHCPLGATRRSFVFGTGNSNADLMVIGEAPGADEDAQGEPFVGAAGGLLTKILAAIDFQRDDVYICNILKCRPPGNRRPETSEIEQCLPYLLKQVDVIRPKVILALGLTAANTLLQMNARMKDLRGRVHDFHGIPVVVTYHPAALLRNAQWKRPTWEDVQMLRRLYDERIAAD